MKKNYTAQFIALPVAVFIAFCFSGLVGSVIVSWFTRWNEPFIGPLCASVVIFVTFWLAPAKKKISGLIALLLGSFAAWFLLRHCFYPEGHPKAYQPTLIPLIVTIAFGIGSYIACFIFWRHEKKPEPNQRPERNAGATSPSTSTPPPGVAHP